MGGYKLVLTVPKYIIRPRYEIALQNPALSKFITFPFHQSLPLAFAPCSFLSPNRPTPVHFEAFEH